LNDMTISFFAAAAVLAGCCARTAAIGNSANQIATWADANRGRLTEAPMTMTDLETLPPPERSNASIGLVRQRSLTF
jgi:hypothetical protein